MLDRPDSHFSRSTRQRIGGRWALAWQTYILTGALGLLALLAGEAQSARGNLAALSWLLIGLGAMAVIGVVLLAFNVTLFRNRRQHPVPIWVVVAADGFVGLAFTLAVRAGASIAGLPTSTNLLESCVLNVLFAMWWGPSLSYFMDLREDWMQEQERLVNEFLEVERSALQQGELLALLQKEIDAQVADELSPARTRIESLQRELSELSNLTVRPPTQWHEAAQLLRDTAEASVRPLSRQLLRAAERSYPRTRWWSLLANVVRKQPFQPFAFAVIDILGTFSPLIRDFGAARGLALLIGGLTWTLLLMLIANALMRLFPRRHSFIFVTALIALQSTVLFRGLFREAWVSGSVSSSWVITQVIAGIAVVFVTSGIGAWWSQRVEVRDTLREEIRSDRVQALAVSQQVALLAHETSRSLHGSVQTRLVSCAMAIEQASTTGDTGLLNSALNEAILVLEQPVPETHAAKSVAKEVERKVALWDGLCSFAILIDSTVATVESSVAVTVGRIVEESISNALRHGKATFIDISITRIDESNVQVVVIDNGLGPRGGKASLGSAFLEQASAGRWSLRALSSGSQLEALVTA